MRKIVMFLFVVMIALSAESQVYVGGTVSSYNDVLSEANAEQNLI